jgi:DNA-binding transcriptional regulator YhcF (GntR family)
MTHKTIINLETGEIKQVELTQEEINFNNQTALINKQKKDLINQELAQQESKKQSAIAKLKALGLDEEEIKSLLGV